LARDSHRTSSVAESLEKKHRSYSHSKSSNERKRKASKRRHESGANEREILPKKKIQKKAVIVAIEGSPRRLNDHHKSSLGRAVTIGVRGLYSGGGSRQRIERP